MAGQQKNSSLAYGDKMSKNNKVCNFERETPEPACHAGLRRIKSGDVKVTFYYRESAVISPILGKNRVK